jgi:PPK2 family polyphosphate:nucleotide phosphotransferase
VKLRTRLAVPTLGGPVGLSRIDPASTPGFKGSKTRGIAETEATGDRLADLQERLYANGRSGDPRRVVLVLQAMDSGGKDGSVKHVVGHVNPAGVHVASFGKPTEEELAHDFLWRVERQVPEAGTLGVFNRSHYEDVLVVRVHDLVPRAVWSRRYARINAWEKRLAAQGVTMLKVFLHVSYEEQRERLLARLDDPTKLWKVNPADLTERGFWDDYQTAYEVALQKCSTDIAPWFVIPADRKWYRNWALAHLLVETLEGLDQEWPTRPDLDLEGLRRVLQDRG